MSLSPLPARLYTSEQVRQLDSFAINAGKVPGIQLMKRAGRAAFELLLANWPCDRVRVYCGGGNNGGDGYVIAALAAQNQMPVEVIAVSPEDTLSGDAARARDYALQEGVVISAWRQDLSLEPGTVVVDALLGTGLSGEPTDHYRAAIESINAANLPVLAVDIPSGLCSNTGRVLGCAVKADCTITFIGLKQGLFTGRGPAFAGDVYFDDLHTSDIQSQDYLEQVNALVPSSRRIRLADFRHTLAEREADAHKGQFGHVMVIGGDTGLGGAAAMAAEMAARCGAGLTSVASRPEHETAILARLPEVMVTGVPSGQALEPLLKKPSVLVVGPGLGTSPWSEQMLQQAGKSGLPMVVDADGLNLLAQARAIPEPYRNTWVLTPHPGEAARMLDTSSEAIQNDRFAAVQALQKKYGGVVVLKGAGTLIADSETIYLANVGNPGMASGGMGDVLAGLIGGLLAQGLSPLDAAALAVCVHGNAADLAAQDSGQRGLLATDLIPYVRELLND